MSINDIKTKIYPTLLSYGVKKAALFGSTVKGGITKKSDIDLLISLPKKASLLDLVGLKIDLEKILGKKVDVLTYDSLHPLLRKRILDEQVPIL
ncbi:MAG: Nucleotidyltransferase domain protein [Syntrophorhabdus sp. PtaU1.Bin050]|nr:MAG: Nucleotidyltransferase domain protein [Syntrophorhabdus sp. PtaU1.Bin050]